jgi:Mitochondrial carrier protein
MLYAGMAFPMVTEGVRCCLFFGIYGKLLGKREERPKYSEIAAAAAVAAAVQGVAATPVELVKIQMQTSGGMHKLPSIHGGCICLYRID